MKKLIEQHKELTDKLIELKHLLFDEEKALNSFIRTTDPKTYGTNEAQREASLKERFESFYALKVEIECVKMSLNHIEFNEKVLALYD